VNVHHRLLGMNVPAMFIRTCDIKVMSELAGGRHFVSFGERREK